MSTERKWIGSTTVNKSQFGDIYRVGFTAEHLEMLKQHLNERGWVNINVATSKAGNGTAWIDEYVKKGDSPAPVNGGEQDLPF